jgi:hypothetical protein
MPAKKKVTTKIHGGINRFGSQEPSHRIIYTALPDSPESRITLQQRSETLRETIVALQKDLHISSKTFMNARQAWLYHEGTPGAVYAFLDAPGASDKANFNILADAFRRVVPTATEDNVRITAEQGLRSIAGRYQGHEFVFSLLYSNSLPTQKTLENGADSLFQTNRAFPSRAFAQAMQQQLSLLLLDTRHRALDKGTRDIKRALPLTDQRTWEEASDVVYTGPEDQPIKMYRFAPQHRDAVHALVTQLKSHGADVTVRPGNGPGETHYDIQHQGHHFQFAIQRNVSLS